MVIFPYGTIFQSATLIVSGTIGLMFWPQTVLESAMWSMSPVDLEFYED